jgi:hypothetical protein
MRREGPVAEPLSREERERIAEIIHPGHFGHVSDVERYEATVQALEAERDRLRHLIDYAMMLHENGEAPPGHELATWDGWYRTVRHALAHDPPAGT